MSEHATIPPAVSGLADEMDEYTEDEGVIAMGPKDVELGDEVIEVERRPRAGVVLSVRLSPDEADRLQGIAETRHTTLSQVAREAITSYLSSGPMGAPAASPWTGTVSGFWNLELTYAGHGATIRTGGQAEQTPAPTLSRPAG